MMKQWLHLFIQLSFIYSQHYLPDTALATEDKILNTTKFSISWNLFCVVVHGINKQELGNNKNIYEDKAEESWVNSNRVVRDSQSE